MDIGKRRTGSCDIVGGPMLRKKVAELLVLRKAVAELHIITVLARDRYRNELMIINRLYNSPEMHDLMNYSGVLPTCFLYLRIRGRIVPQT